ncbi:TonB-dependent receptor [Rapidithrix thailandica]|uniref:TonB-dependent receptor n=1 Tax=Rapidithrix thailandica TaxID=413964 RepID=A0AAW9RX72_9BACT
MKNKLLRVIIMCSIYSMVGLVVQTMLLTVLLASPNYAQKGKSVKEIYLTLRLKNADLQTVIQEIEDQTDFYFSYDLKHLDSRRLFTFNSRKISLNKVLQELAKQGSLNIRRINNAIDLKKASERNRGLEEIMTPVQDVVVSGKVTSGENGEPLPGVSILQKGTTKGTSTDFEGRYSLRVPEDAILQFSFIGYQTKEVTVGNQTTINVVLPLDMAELEEVVVVGYGVQKKENLTGAVEVISNEQIENRQSPTVSQLLQGQSPGLTFSVNNNGFQPGANVGIDIRGIGSLNGGEPYVIIDGIPGDMNRLNPEDIESISVLKDAAASAIYGARAPFGVILITTKSGTANQKITATYSGSVSFASPQRLPEMLDSHTHARVLNEAGVHGRGGQPYSNEVIDRIVAYQEGDFDYLKQFTVPDAIYYETMPRPNGTWGFNQNGNANYDWFDEYYGNALNQKHNLSFQGGGQKTSFYFSAGYLGQEGVLNYGTDTYERVNVMGKVKTKITDWWDFSYQPRFMKSNRVIPNMDKQGSYDLIFHQIARTMPSNAKYDGYGNIMIQSKIPWVDNGGTDNIEVTENWQTFSTELRPLKGWKVNADFAYKSVDYFRSDQELTVYDHLVDKSTIPSGNTVPSNIQQYHQSNSYWTSNIYSSYSLTIKEQHNFMLLGGMQFEVNKGRSLDVIKNNILVQDVLSLQTATGEPAATESLSHWATQGFFGRFTYDFKGKYLVEANVRRDGTSRFREGNRWGFFPSFSVGWNVHEEPFWKGLNKIVNTLKFRGSWGELGNQNVTAYQDLALIPLRSSALNWIFDYGQTRPVGYTGTPSLVSPDLTWETVSTKNVGIDAGFFKNKLKVNFDVFERETSNMIGPSEAQPGVLGASLPQANNATLRTRGWELAVRWSQTLNNQLTYYITTSLYDSRAVVTKYLNPTGTLSSWYEGREQGEIWGYTVNDLYRSQEEVDAYTEEMDLTAIWGGTWRPGDVKYEDTNGDGAVNNGSYTVDDHGDLSIIGNSTPHYQYGISAGVNFKGFDFSMLWQGTAKRDLYFNGDQNMYWGFRTWNQSSLFPEHLDYYRDQEGDKYIGVAMGADNLNTDAFWPRPYIHNGENNKNRIASTRYLANGAYLRLQNVQLGYNLPETFLNKLSLQKLRVYASGENLFTITKLPKGIDPVAINSTRGVGKTYGADRIISLGLTVTY